jgi:hypothetical protein
VQVTLTASPAPLAPSAVPRLPPSAPSGEIGWAATCKCACLPTCLPVVVLGQPVSPPSHSA